MVHAVARPLLRLWVHAGVGGLGCPLGGERMGPRAVVVNPPATSRNLRGLAAAAQPAGPSVGPWIWALLLGSASAYFRR